MIQLVAAARLLLATLLGFGGEILLWQSPLTRNIVDWLLISAGYGALACLLLEVAARFRWRDVYGLLAVAGLYALLNALLLNPVTSFAEFPRTLFTRVLGAHALVGALMIALWRWLLQPGSRLPVFPLSLSIIVGGIWGIWAHWSASLFQGDVVATETPIELILLCALLSIGLVAGARLLMARSASSDTTLELPHFYLGRVGWLFTASTLVTLAIVQLSSGAIDGLSITVCFALALMCLGIVYFQKRKKGRTLFDGLQPRPIRWISLLLIVAMVAAAVLTYPLPRGEGENDPVFVIAAVFTAYGIAWLPGIALAIGVRGFIRQVQTHRL